MNANSEIPADVRGYVDLYKTLLQPNASLEEMGKRVSEYPALSQAVIHHANVATLGLRRDEAITTSIFRIGVNKVLELTHESYPRRTCWAC